MAKRTVVKFVDDLDGKELKEAVTVAFGVNGREYEFDTSPAHAQEFEQTLERYVAVSRVPGRSLRSFRDSKRAQPHTQAIRRWARNNGFAISDRGRIAAEIVAAFQAAR
ncbi:MAG: Lsr2 family protein [Gordonia sp. (in: high G+C Gram-positive bacteria)]